SLIIAKIHRVEEVGIQKLHPRQEVKQNFEIPCLHRQTPTFIKRAFGITFQADNSFVLSKLLSHGSVNLPGLFAHSLSRQKLMVIISHKAVNHPFPIRLSLNMHTRFTIGLRTRPPTRHILRILLALSSSRPVERLV